MKKILLFGKEGCNPCATAKEMFKSSNIEFQYIDIMENLNLVGKYGIRNVPTTLIMEDDKEVKRFVGLTNLEEVLV